MTASKLWTINQTDDYLPDSTYKKNISFVGYSKARK